jgi:hypothetical protein
MDSVNKALEGAANAPPAPAEETGGPTYETEAPTYDEKYGWDGEPPMTSDTSVDPNMLTSPPMDCTASNCVFNETTGKYEQPPLPPPNFPTPELGPPSSQGSDPAQQLPPEYRPFDSEYILPGGITREQLNQMPMNELNSESSPAPTDGGATSPNTTISAPDSGFSAPAANTPNQSPPSFFSDPLGAISGWAGSAWSYLKSLF